MNGLQGYFALEIGVNCPVSYMTINPVTGVAPRMVNATISTEEN